MLERVINVQEQQVTFNNQSNYTLRSKRGEESERQGMTNYSITVLLTIPSGLK